MCIQTGKTLQDESRMRMNTEELYVKSEAEMRAVFPNFPEAIENSQKIAQRCQVDLRLRPSAPAPLPHRHRRNRRGNAPPPVRRGAESPVSRSVCRSGFRALQAAGIRAFRHFPHGICGLLSHRVGLHQLRQEPRHHGRPRPRQRRGQHRGLHPAHHHAGSR